MKYLKTITASYFLTITIVILFSAANIYVFMAMLDLRFIWIGLFLQFLFLSFIWSALQIKFFFQFARKFDFHFFPGPLFWLIASTGLQICLFFAVYLSSRVFGEVKYEAGNPQFWLTMNPKNILILFGTMFSLYAMAVYLSIVKSIRD